MKIDTNEVKQRSEAAVLEAGGEICDWLPWIEFTKMRDDEEVISRSLILNAMLQIAFGAPTEVIANWLEHHELTTFLSESEQSILARQTEDLSEQERTNLFWYIEALWAFLWATKLVETINFTTNVPDTMAAKCPNLQQNEGTGKFAERMELRGYDELYRERDLYYRVMWHARQVSLKGNTDERFDMSRTMERRRALSWILDASLDWDDVPQDT